MKSRSLLTSLATLISLTAAPAMAADMRMPVKAPPAPVQTYGYNWTGFYIGAHVGGVWGDKRWYDAEFAADLGKHDLSGFLAGGQVGFNWQAPGSNWVIGIEGQASWANADGEHGLPNIFVVDTLRTEVEWLGTVTGRLGYAFDRVLVYAKGGFAFAHDKHEISSPEVAPILPAFFSSGDKTRFGWTVGGGIEVALGGNWSAKGEYNYMDFGNKSVTFTNNSGAFQIDIDQQIHVAKFGINYRFGGFGGPVVARY